MIDAITYRIQKSPPTNGRWLGLILLSFAMAFTHSGPLNGTLIALLGTVLLQVYLPGILLARALGKLADGHIIVRFVWVLASGLGLTISLGAIVRFLQVPLQHYLIVLHVVMIALSFVRRPSSAEVATRLRPHNTLFYVLLAISALIALGVGYERNQIRIAGFEDQSEFISLANWLANDPDDPGLRTRRLGVPVGDFRMDIDGWTYTHAAWSWASGVSAADLIWKYLTPLFVWTIPLVIFASVYLLAEREDLAAWSAATLVLAGLLTLDNLVYNPTDLAFGQFGLFQLNTLRTASRALMFPLGIFSMLAFLRARKMGDLVVLLLATVALASMHAQQLMTFLIVSGASGTVWLLAQRPTRRELIQSLGVLGLSAPVIIIAIMQRAAFGASNFTREFEAALFSPEQPHIPNVLRHASRFVMLEDVPLIGDTYTVKPDAIFYHPMVALALVLGLLAGLAWRRNLAARYTFAATAAVTILFFTPGLTEFFTRATFAPAVPGIVFGLPIALAFALGIDGLLQLLKPLPNFQRHGTGLTTVALGVALLVLVFEPLPISASGRDQIRAANRSQQARSFQPSDQLLLDELAALLPTEGRSILLTPNRVANFIVESVPHTLVTGGRGASANATYQPTKRFFADNTPWLDNHDIAFIAQWGVTQVVVEADDTRVPQLMMDSQRFDLAGTAAGHFIFHVNPGIQAGASDELFGSMNTTYAGMTRPRFDQKRFALARPGDSQSWQPLIEQWTAMLDSNPDDDRARYALAFARLMAGEDEAALSLWNSLRRAYPGVFQFTDAAAFTHSILDDPIEGTTILSDALDSGDPVTEVLAAQSLLTDTFFAFLTDAQVNRVIEAATQNELEWSQLVTLDRPDSIRQNVSLMISADQWGLAQLWLQGLPGAELGPADMLTMAAATLVTGDIDDALSILEPATDDDQIAANRFLHPDRWQNNVAAQAYFLLQGELALRESRWNDAEESFLRAVDEGSLWAGRYFLANTLEASGQVEAAATIRTQLDDDWAQDREGIFPELVSLLEVADHNTLHILQPEITHGETINIRAIYGDIGPQNNPFPITELFFQVTNPEATAHYLAEIVPISFIAGALVRSDTSLSLPADIPPLTPARVFIQPRFDNRLVFAEVAQDLTLNRPASQPIGADVTPLQVRFGDVISLQGIQTEVSDTGLDVTLYWETGEPLAEDYQVFVHILDEDGQLVTQSDSAPASGRYPTGQWLEHVTIEDTHSIALEAPLITGNYQVSVGLYRAHDGSRLPFIAADDNERGANVVELIEVGLR